MKTLSIACVGAALLLSGAWASPAPTTLSLAPNQAAASAGDLNPSTDHVGNLEGLYLSLFGVPKPFEEIQYHLFGSIDSVGDYVGLNQAAQPFQLSVDAFATLDYSYLEQDDPATYKLLVAAGAESVRLIGTLSTGIYSAEVAGQFVRIDNPWVGEQHLFFPSGDPAELDLTFSLDEEFNPLDGNDSLLGPGSTGTGYGYQIGDPDPLGETLKVTEHCVEWNFQKFNSGDPNCQACQIAHETALGVAAGEFSAKQSKALGNREFSQDQERNDYLKDMALIEGAFLGGLFLCNFAPPPGSFVCLAAAYGGKVTAMADRTGDHVQKMNEIQHSFENAMETARQEYESALASANGAYEACIVANGCTLDCKGELCLISTWHNHPERGWEFLSASVVLNTSCE